MLKYNKLTASDQHVLTNNVIFVTSQNATQNIEKNAEKNTEKNLLAGDDDTIIQLLICII